MKRGLIILLVIVFCMGFLAAESTAEACNLNVSLINQDPYPAIPGEAVKIVFQIDGVSNPVCKTLTFELKEGFPFTIDPGSQNPVTIDAGIYAKRYSSFYIASYTIRVDDYALDGNSPIEFGYISTAVSGERLKDFNIYVENTRADFEIYVKDYNPNTGIMTLEILNVADVNAQALAIEIPKQENIAVTGANRVIIGDLDSNEYTTADFEAMPKDGKINLEVIYTDDAAIRREITKTIEFDSSYFSTKKASPPYLLYFLIVIVTAGIAFWIIRSRQKKKKRLNKKF